MARPATFVQMQQTRAKPVRFVLVFHPAFTAEKDPKSRVARSRRRKTRRKLLERTPPEG
jgi:hypothetical protein